jgi:hypothetical protein
MKERSFAQVSSVPSVAHMHIRTKRTFIHHNFLVSLLIRSLMHATKLKDSPSAGEEAVFLATL